MKIAIVIMAAAAVLFTASSCATTEPRTADQRIFERLRSFDERIKKGVADDSLTIREERALVRHLNEINTARERRLEAEGQLTETESARLHRRSDLLNEHLYKLRHNLQVRQ